jgi:predicted nucleic acid-binding protein
VTICDTGPLVSAMNRSEGNRHRFAAALLARLGRQVIVPRPVLTEVDRLLRARGHPEAALVFANALHGGVHRLEAPTNDELATALGLGDRYPDSGVDLPDLTVMAMSRHRRAEILTWDFRHVRTVVLRRGPHGPLLAAEHELPSH